MTHKYIWKRAIQAVLLVFLLSGCTDWLSVEDVDKQTESQVFASEMSIQQTLNGVYLGMGTNASYGRDLSLGTIELLGQQSALSGATLENHALKYSMINYSYNTDAAKSRFLSIWTQAYSSILNINNFIDKLDKTEGVIAADKKDILLGEAYGLRAYLHLDLLRLFGPVYLTDSTGISIPYRTEPKIGYSQRIAANEAMGKIMSDLERSISLLENDPIITLGVMKLPADSLTAEQKKVGEFYRKRNQRMNYYAANALKVRTLMYRNNKTEAAALAKTLLAAIDEKFPWATSHDVFLYNKEDRIFSSEVIFGVHSTNMYTNWTNLFSPGETTAAPLYVATTTNLEKLYELQGEGGFSLCSDWRSKNWLAYSLDAQYMLSYKLAKSTKETSFWYLQPLIRKTELYYAIAESDGDVEILNTVRLNRGIKRVEDIHPAYDIDEEVQNEFRREMYNEGQQFFFYKRKNMDKIPSGSSNSTVSMTSARYMIPIPESEIDK